MFKLLHIVLYYIITSLLLYVYRLYLTEKLDFRKFFADFSVISSYDIKIIKIIMIMLWIWKYSGGKEKEKKTKFQYYEK